MADSLSWPTRIASVNFVAHPGQRDRAQRLFLERLNRIPTDRARIHFVSAYPDWEEDEFDLWMLRCTAVYEAQRAPLPDPATLELFSVHCVLSINPDFEDEVSESLFFCDHSEPDPFPGTQYGVDLIPFVPGREWRDGNVAPETPAEPVKAARPSEGTQWLVTLYLAASAHETGKLAVEYSRLIHAVDQTLDLLSSSPVPMEVEDYSILGPLWLADTRKAVAEPASVTEYPPTRHLHRARLILNWAEDPVPLLPQTQLPGTWEAEPLG